MRKFVKNGVTGRKLMRWIGEVCARFVRANEFGEIEFAWYTPSGVTIAPTGENYYFSGSFSREKYSVAPIDTVQIRFANSEAGYLWPGADEGVNIYAISDNPFLSSISDTNSDEVAAVLDVIRDELDGVTYTPCKVSVPASYGIKAGQIVDILSKDGTSITTYVMKSTTSGQRTALECTGSLRRDSTTAVNNKTPTESAKDILLGETLQEVFDRLTGMSKDQGIYMEDGKIYINANYIKAGTLMADEVKLSAAGTYWFYSLDSLLEWIKPVAQSMTPHTQKTYSVSVEDHPVYGTGKLSLSRGYNGDGFDEVMTELNVDAYRCVITGYSEGGDGTLSWTNWKITGGEDAVIEQGTHGIWTYRKWNSGKIELWTNSHQFTIAFTRASTGIYYATQSGIPVPLVKTIEFVSGDCTKWHYVNWASVTCNDGLTLGIRYYGLNGNGDGNTIPFSFYVIGTWK